MSLENDSAPQNLKPRILVVDNDPEIREANVTKLRYWNYEPVAAAGMGRALLKDAAEKAARYRCQLATVDLHLLDDHDRADFSGLDLIQQLLPTRSVIHSGSVSFQTVREALSNSAALAFVGKSESPEYLRDVLNRYAAQFCASRHATRIEWPEGLSSAIVIRLLFPDEPDVPEDEAEDVLIRLFPNATVVQLENLSSHSSASASLPRPRSIVMKAREDGTQPVIVKLARTMKMEKEVEKYDLHIKRRLSGSYLPVMEARSILWDMGGAVYTFVGSDIIPLSQFYGNTATKTKHLTDCLDKFFNQMWLPHYQQSIQREESSLTSLYFAVWYGDWWLKRLEDYNQSGRVAEILSGWPVWLACGLPEPVRWLAQHVEAEQQGDGSTFKVAITHGDLHSENLLVDVDSHNAWVIDFERTGYGHIFQDFVELEGDLLTHLIAIPGDDIDRLYALFVSAAGPTRLRKPCRLNTGDPQLKRGIKILNFLRRTAAERSGESSTREYLYGLLLNALFRAMLLLNAQDPDAKIRPSLMLAAILCYRLDHWQEAWPPIDWPPVSLKRGSEPISNDTTIGGYHV